MTPHDNDKLERLIQSMAKGLPARPAPRTLESRVFAEIARRAALPWYRQSFSHWPAAIRTLFLLLSAGMAAATVFVLLRLTDSGAPTQLGATVEMKLAWIDGLKTAVNAISDSVRSTLSSIPPVWLYGTVAAVVACYATLVGLSAAAYRMFRQPS